MRRVSKKLNEIYKLSAKCQLDIDKSAKAAYLIEMLQTIAKEGINHVN